MANIRPDTIRFTMEQIPEAVTMLRKGGLVAVPTETVYGLATSALDGVAARLIYDRKDRDYNKPLSVLVSGMEMVEQYCQNIPQAAYKLAEKYWPGPLTMVLEDNGTVPGAVTADEGTLGVRCPDHPITLSILRTLDEPLAAPSANPSGQPSPKTAAEVLAYFDGQIEGILDGGPCAVGVESTVLDLTGEEPKILREGGIEGDELLQFLRELEKN